MTNTNTAPIHLNLSTDMLERLGKDIDKGDQPWLEPQDIIGILADDSGMWTQTEAREALAMSRDSILYASTLLQR